jgi:hypothetical protein
MPRRRASSVRGDGSSCRSPSAATTTSAATRNSPPGPRRTKAPPACPTIVVEVRITTPASARAEGVGHLIRRHAIGQKCRAVFHQVAGVTVAGRHASPDDLGAFDAVVVATGAKERQVTIAGWDGPTTTASRAVLGGIGSVGGAKAVLVLGGGIAGAQTALHLARFRGDHHPSPSCASCLAISRRLLCYDYIGRFCSRSRVS